MRRAPLFLRGAARLGLTACLGLSACSASSSAPPEPTVDASGSSMKRDAAAEGARDGAASPGQDAAPLADAPPAAIDARATGAEAGADAPTAPGPDAGSTSGGPLQPGKAMGGYLSWTTEKVAVNRALSLDGPVWLASQGKLLMGDVETRELLLFTPPSGVQLFSKRTLQPTGNALDPMGRLLTVEAGNGSDPGQVVRFLDGDRTEALLPLSANQPGPSDLAVHQPSGTIYVALFTGGKVLRMTGAGGGVQTVDGVVNPQGVALSPDQRTLYVVSKAADMQMGEVYTYPVNVDGSTGARSGTVVRLRSIMNTFTGRSGPLNRPLGVMVDGRGYLYVSGNPEVGVFKPDGGFLGVITTAGGGDTTNCAYGDADGRTLYITSYGGLFRARPQIP